MSKLFNELREGEEYINLSFRVDLGRTIIKQLNDEEYHLHYIKEKNEAYKDDEVLTSLYKDKKKVQKLISIREQDLNQKK